VSTVSYNHYSWLRTMEDVFDVAGGRDYTPLASGNDTVSGGLDGLGHLGYAAQPGLRPFGLDVFTNPSGHVRPRLSETGRRTRLDPAAPRRLSRGALSSQWRHS